MRTKLSIIAILFFSVLAFAADEPQQSHVYVTFEGTAGEPTITPGKPTEVELRFRVKEGFHVNSNKPKSELLIPTVLKLDVPTDLAAGTITYPPGKDLSFPFDPSEKLNVYADDFTLKATLSAVRNANAGNFTVHGQLHYQACSDNACFPPKNVPVQFDVHVTSANSGHGRTAQTAHLK